MKKSNPPVSKLSPKAISLNRLNISKLMKVPANEGYFVNNKNITAPLVKKHTPYKQHDRNVKDVPVNPFRMPDFQKLFTKSIPTKKVREEPLVMSDLKTICDVDPSFYKLIEGRPIRSFVDVKVYICNIRDITLFRTNTAFMNQEIISIDTKHNEEVQKYNKILDLYCNTKLNFNIFARESWDIAKAMQEKAELVAEKKASVEVQLEKVQFQYVELRNEISDVYYRYCTLLTYKKFLSSISPTYRQAEFDPSHYNKDEVISQISVHFIRESLSADSLMNVYKDCVKNFEPPLIYFECPEQLVDFYEDLRLQCLNYIQIDVITSKRLKSLLSCRDTFEQNMKISCEDMLDYIEVFERAITFLEDRADTFKTLFFKILNTQVEKLYASYDTIKLFTCIQYVHKQIFGGHEEPKDDIVALMSEIETEYIRHTVILDAMDIGMVKDIANKIFTDDINMMNRARKASKTLKESLIMRKSLYASFEPPRHFRPRLTPRK